MLDPFVYPRRVFECYGGDGKWSKIIDKNPRFRNDDQAHQKNNSRLLTRLRDFDLKPSLSKNVCSPSWRPVERTKSSFNAFLKLSRELVVTQKCYRSSRPPHRDQKEKGHERQSCSISTRRKRAVRQCSRSVIAVDAWRRTRNGVPWAIKRVGIALGRIWWAQKLTALTSTRDA